MSLRDMIRELLRDEVRAAIREELGGSDATARRRSCRDKVGADSAVHCGCKRCSTTSRTGFVEGAKAQLGEMSRMVGVALGEILLATVTTPILVGATALRARIPVAEWQRITGQEKIPDARVIGRGLGTLAVAPPPGPIVSLARGKGNKGPAQWQVERVAARMP